MKYTKYVFNLKFIDLDALQTQNRLFKFPVLVMSIPIAFIELGFLTTLMSFAIIVDEYRGVKYRLIRIKRNNTFKF